MGFQRTRAALLLLMILAGCSQNTARVQNEAESRADEERVRSKFTDLQAALKDADSDRLWRLLSSQSQVEADRIAGKIQAAYLNGSPEEKAEQ